MFGIIFLLMKEITLQEKEKNIGNSKGVILVKDKKGHKAKWIPTLVFLQTIVVL